MPSDKPPKSQKRALRIGKYEVLNHIATGGMGAVYRARDTKLGREVALKVLPNEMAANEAALKRFLREAELAAKLRHENIVTLYESDQINGTYYLAMELIEGIDLPATVGRRLQIGVCRFAIGGETTPCDRMEELQPGLRRVLIPGLRGGVWGKVLQGGPLRVGDAVQML